MKVPPMAKSLKKALKDSGRKVMDWAIAHGWSCEMTKGNHIRYTHPKVPMVYHDALTASDYRGALNCRARMRRAMLDAGFTPEQVR